MLMTKEPPVLEEVERLGQLLQAGIERYKKKGDERDKETLLQVYARLQVLLAEMESRLDLARPVPED